MIVLVDFVVRKIRLFLDIVAFIIGAIFYPSKTQYLAPITSNLLLEPATRLAVKIKTGKVSIKLKSEDLVKAYVDRCRKINGDLNAIVDDNYEEALREAREVDERVQRELNGERQPNEPSIHEFPFLGVPFTTKNSIQVKDKTWSGGIYARKGVKGERDAFAIERMKKVGGAIFLGVTNIPELVMWMDSFNRVDGQTNNPYDQSRIPGGSSGGEGALIGAAGSVFGVGSDIGGSIRIPSHFCGIFGHKTTPAAVSKDGIYPTFTGKRLEMCSIGPMCRYSCDLRPMLKVLAGDHLDLPDKPLNYSNLNVYYMLKIDDPMAAPVDVDIEQGLDKVIKHFIEKGSRTIELDTTKQFYDLRWAYFIWCVAMNDPSNRSFLDLLSEGNPSSINPYIELFKCMIGRQKKYTSSILTLALTEELNLSTGEYKKEVYTEIWHRMRKELHQLLDINGVILCPTFPEIAFKHNQSLLKSQDIVYTALWNALNVSVTVVPLGLDRHGMPISVQIIASPNNDNLGIQIAEELEKQFGGWVPPCPVQFAN
ncbi:Fatty-acid amide hydrolase 2 [Blomia tropicalis]|nr:Fatty-acid amide hydrolase 2 [Blomia tropicalis]